MVKHRSYACVVELVKSFYYFLLSMLCKESIVEDQSLEIKIWMDLHVLRSPESEETFLSGGFSVCVSVINIIPKQAIEEIQNLVFFLLYHM